MLYSIAGKFIFQIEDVFCLNFAKMYFKGHGNTFPVLQNIFGLNINWTV